MEHDFNNFWHNRNIYNFDLYNVFLSISTNIPQRLTLLCAPGTQFNIMLILANSTEQEPVL